MAARPEPDTAAPTAPAPTPVRRRPARPRLRDRGGRVPIEWDVRPIYDFLFSLTDDAGVPARPASRSTAPGSTDAAPDARRSAIQAEAIGRRLRHGHPRRARSPSSTPSSAPSTPSLTPSRPTPTAGARSSTMLVRPRCRIPTSARSSSRRRPATEPALAPCARRSREHKVGSRSCSRTPRPGIARLIAILRTWATAVRRRSSHGSWPTWSATTRFARSTAAPHDSSDLIERTTGGIRWLPEVGIRRVILAPSYFSRPYNILLAGPDWRFFAYPVADDALEAERPRWHRRQSVVRLHRALGDATRLRILKLLAGTRPLPDRDRPAARTVQADHQAPPGPAARGRSRDGRRGRTVIYYSLRRDRHRDALQPTSAASSAPDPTARSAAEPPAGHRLDIHLTRRRTKWTGLIDRFVRDRTDDLHRVADGIRRERDLRPTVASVSVDAPVPTPFPAGVKAAVSPCGETPTVQAARRAA